MQLESNASVASGCVRERRAASMVLSAAERGSSFVGYAAQRVENGG
jgi:hypothetical protein